jgi:hypothetical protein
MLPFVTPVPIGAASLDAGHAQSISPGLAKLVQICSFPAEKDWQYSLLRE